MSFNIVAAPRLLGALLAWSLAASAVAETAAEFPVTDKQMQAMGIRLVALAAGTNTGKAAYPAKVVLPTNSEFVVSAPLNGLVTQVLVEPGQAVKKGQGLVRLDSPDLARLQLEALQAANREKLSRQTLTREAQLYKDGIIPERRWQEADSAFRDASAALSQTRSALLVSGMNANAINQLIKSGALEQGLVLGARTAGVVTNITARPGMRVEAASPLLSLASVDALGLEIQLPSQQSIHIKAGSKGSIAGRDASATIVSISPLVGSGQTVMARARITANAGQLRPGELVQLELPLLGDGAWDLPLSALARQGEKAYVFVRTAKGFTARPVTVVGSGGQQVRVQGAFKAGEQVAVSSVVTLKAAWMGESGGE